jgi:hypothetical protein
MKPHRRRQRADEEHDLGIVDFLSEAEGGTPAVPSRPWPAVGVNEFASEEPVPPASAMTADTVAIRVAAARPAPRPNAMLRVITFGVYAVLAIGGAAVGWFVGGLNSALAPDANPAALVTSASQEWVPFAALREPALGNSIGSANVAPEQSAEARVERLATPPPNAANVPSVNEAARPVAPRPVTPPPGAPRSAVSAPAAIAETAPPPPPTASPAAPRPAAAVAIAASTPEVPKPEPPPSEPPRPASAPTAAPRAEAPRADAPRADVPRADAPRADASRPELPRAEAARRRETGLIETVLDRYVGAFNTLDAEAARVVWPGVDARALDRVFRELEEQELTFEECRIELDEVRATAVCRGLARYVPRVGSRSSRSTSRQWTFRLQKVEDRWAIDGVNIR